MKKILKRIVLFIFAITILIVVGVGFLFWRGTQNTNDVNVICGFPNGTLIEDVMKRARELGFSENSQGALGSGWVVFVDNQEIKWSNDGLPGINNGKLRLGKVAIPPFLRNYCEITFQNRVVTEKRTWTLD